MTLKETLNSYGKDKEPFFFCISYDLKDWEVHKLSQLPLDIQYSLNNQNQTTSKNKNQLNIKPINFEKYKNKFNTLQTQIENGNTYLANLTSQTKLTTEYSLKDIYTIANAKFKLYFKDKFVCFSPERFIECKNNKIYTYPMKGTIDASIKNAKDTILNNQKELAEHTMIVDLLRNDLSIVSHDVKVDKFRYCETIDAGEKQLIQVSSQISGKLEINWHENIGDILTSLLPAGSITGAPKKKTVEVLESIENYDRDFFTGIFGVFDGINLDSAVMIRYIEKNTSNNLIYKSGGGITSDSIAKEEYQEMIDKVYIP